jgi:hypothetical protein
MQKLLRSYMKHMELLQEKPLKRKKWIPLCLFQIYETYEIRETLEI